MGLYQKDKGGNLKKKKNSSPWLKMEQFKKWLQYVEIIKSKTK